MEALISLSSVIAPLVRDNIDTDTIIPATFLRSLATDPASGLFAHWRFLPDGTEDPSFILHDRRFRGARILLSGANFGCGSSRENAVWALQRFGIRCVIARGFSDIFYESCFKNGVLPIVCNSRDHQMLVERSSGPEPYLVTVYVGTRQLRDSGGVVLEFELDQHKQTRLMNGTDEVASTLEMGDRIEHFRAGHRARNPWLYGSEE